MTLEFYLTNAQSGFFIVSIVALAALLTVGKTPERIAAVTLFGLMIASFYFSLINPLANALASALALLILVLLTLRYERWWLIGAAGFQLVVFSTHLAPLVLAQERTWSTVTLRIILWGGLMALCVFAMGESRWATYAARDGRMAKSR